MNRFLVISSEFPPGPGGIGQHAHSMTIALRQQEKVHVLCNQDYSEQRQISTFNSNLPGNCVMHHFISRTRNLATMRRLLQAFQLVKDVNPDVILVTGRLPLWIGGMLKYRYPNIRVIGIAHGTEISLSGGWAAAVTAFFYQRLDKLVAVSTFTETLLHTKMKRNKVVIVPNGLDAETLAIQPGATQHFVGSPALLTVGNLTPRKGQHRVVKALPVIRSYHPQVHYHIVGLPTQAKRIESLARELGVQANLTIHGRVASHCELLSMYRSADVFIMLSENQSNGDVEGFGIAILEANAFGIPAIGAKGCGIEDAISSQSGLLVDGDDPEEIAKAVSSILQNYDSFSQGARKWAEKHNWDGLIKQIIA